MSQWKTVLAKPDPATWHAVCEMLDEHIQRATQTCISRESPTDEIRAAQMLIETLRTMRNLPANIASTSAPARGNRTGY